jgi:DNA polymerase-3 subunit alpha
MVFFELEDLEGSVEVVAFPKVVSLAGPMIREDAVVVVTGHLDHRGDDIKVIARDISEPELRSDEVVRLRVPAIRISPDLVTRLQQVLSNHPGPAPVFLEMTSDNEPKVWKLSDEYRVEPRSALYAELRELLGAKAVT